MLDFNATNDWSILVFGSMTVTAHTKLAQKTPTWCLHVNCQLSIGNFIGNFSTVLITFGENITLVYQVFGLCCRLDRWTMPEGFTPNHYPATQPATEASATKTLIDCYSKILDPIFESQFDKPVVTFGLK